MKTNGKDAEWWDVDNTTSNALKDWNSLINISGGQLTKIAACWRERGKKIHSLLDLIRCYYSGFKIICIPAARYPPSLIKQQYEKLYNEINTASSAAWGRRESSGFLMSAEELEYYLESAFDHFSKHPTTPFNFLTAACLYNPVAPTLKTHIVRLALYFMSCYPDDNGMQLFERVAPLVASSIFLDSHRQRYPARRKCSSAALREFLV